MPSRINLNNAEDFIEIKFRVRRPSKNVYIVYKLGDEVLKKVYKLAIIPSEMEIFKLPKSLIQGKEGTLSVSLLPKEEN